MPRAAAGATAPLVTGQKRRADDVGKATASGPRKRQKAQDARAIRVQPSDAALSNAGELNVAAFIRAREFEINALDKSMQQARKGLMTRAFQQVPRHIRRRTASHNVKKVPRRLRRRAEREMKEDNTTTVTARRRTPSRQLRLRLELAKSAKKFNERSKILREKKREAEVNAELADQTTRLSVTRLPRVKKNMLANSPSATSKFKKRQLHKTWLPTHLWHAKRAHMTKTGNPLWRMTIPLSPTEKSYRPTHRAGGSRGCIAWDMSYMSTIGCQGTEDSLQNMLKALGFHGEGWSGAKNRRWSKGTRSAEGWLCERDSDKRLISPVTVIWCVESTSEHSRVGVADGGDTVMADRPIYVGSKKPPQRRLVIRIHPSAFHQCWLELLKVAKLQRPQVLLEDLRFEIGSIEITGPGSTEALVGVLKPIGTHGESADSAGKLWPSLAGIHNAAALPQNVILTFNVMDPRLSHPPKQISAPQDDSAAALAQLAVAWPPDNSSLVPDIFSHKKRYTATTAMPSQKAINRRQTLRGAHGPLQPTERDARIPVMLLAARPPNHSSNSQGSWTLLLPWKCVDAVWRSLMYYPLSSGSTPQFGGLNEKRQLDFEHGQPWYPGDFPGTEAGQAWERTESEKRFDEWLRRPASRRIAWDRVILGNGKRGEHGLGWACDWEFLIHTSAGNANAAADEVTDGNMQKDNPVPLPSPVRRPLTQRQRKAAKAAAAKIKAAAEGETRRRNTSSPESDTTDSLPLESELTPPPKMQHATPSQALMLSHLPPFANLPPTAVLATIRITLLTRGTPNAAARIYRLPSSSLATYHDLRKQWLKLDPTITNSFQPTNANYQKLKKHPPKSHTVQPRDDPTFIYLPPGAHSDVVNTYGASAQPQRSSTPTAEERDELLKSLLYPGMTSQERKKHPDCPDVGDLIGFVTSGAYDLAAGRGRAVGGVWLQKVLDGWRAEEVELGTTARNGPEGKKWKRERHLCIIRNAGESVGRLGTWEVCV